MYSLALFLAVVVSAAGLLVIRAKAVGAAVQDPVRIEVRSDEEPLSRTR